MSEPSFVKEENKQLREKGPNLDSWSGGRKLFQRAGSSYSFSTKHYFIIPTLRAPPSWCRAVREEFIRGKHHHLFLLTFSRPGHQLLKLGEKLRCEQEMPIPSEIGLFPSCLSSKSVWLFSKGEEEREDDVSSLTYGFLLPTLCSLLPLPY